MKKKKMETQVAPMMDKRKSTARFSLEDSDKLPKLLAGETVSVTVKGKVRSFNSSKYDRSFEVEITDMETDSGLKGDLRSIKKKRTFLDMED